MAASSLFVAAESDAIGATVVHGENQHATAAALGAARLSKTKVIFDAHGALPEEAVLNGQERGFSPARIAREAAMARTWESLAWRRASGVVAVSSRLIERFSSVYGQRSGPAIVIPCATSPAAMPPAAARSTVRARYGLTDREVIVYVGSLAPYQQAPEMVSLFAAIYAQRPSACLFIVSQSPAENWEAILYQNQLPRSAYHLVSAREDEVPALTAAGDIGLMLRRDSVVNEVAFPTKMAEYLAAGVPVLATAATVDPARFIVDHGVGVVAPSIDAIDSVAAGNFLSEVMTDRQAWSDRCRASAERFLMWPRFAPALAALYDNVLRLPPASAVKGTVT